MMLDLGFLRTNIPVQKYPILKFVRLYVKISSKKSKKTPLKSRINVKVITQKADLNRDYIRVSVLGNRLSIIALYPGLVNNTV
jgi:hypothetical protein